MSTSNYWSDHPAATRSRRRFLRLAAGAAGAGALAFGPAACGSSSKNNGGTSTSAGSATTSAPSARGSTPASAAAAATPNRSKQGARVRLAIGAEPTTTDPHQSTGGVDYFYLFQMFNQLYTWGYDGTLQPSLAQSYEVTPDGSQITFHLRAGVKFQNGDPFTANDVAYSFNRLISPDNKGTKTAFVNVDSTQAVDPQTFVYKMKKGDAGFILGGFGNLDIVPQTYTDKAGPDQFAKAPIGTGAYKLTNRTIGQGATFERYDGYFAGPAAFQRAEYTLVPDGNGRVNALQVGDADIVTALPPELVKTVKGMNSVRVVIQQSNTDTYFGFGLRDYPGTSANPTQQLLRDRRVRQALNLAVDKAGIAKNIYGTDLAQPYAVTNSTQAWDIKKVYDYKPSDAKGMLSAAGASGINVAMYHLLGGRLPALAELGSAVASNLRDVGVNVAEKPEEYDAWLARLRVDTPPFANDGMIFSWASTAGYPDPFQGADSKWISRGRYSQWTDPQFDGLIEQARTTFDATARVEILKQAFNYMYDQAPGLWLVLLQDANAIRTNTVADWKPRVGSNPVLRLEDLSAA